MECRLGGDRVGARNGTYEAAARRTKSVRWESYWRDPTRVGGPVDGGRLCTRFANGTWFTGEMPAGSTVYSALSADEPEIHDLENVGDTTVRFTTVELLDA